MNLLKEKVSIVTGGGSGIGRECVLKLSGQGSKVIVSDIDETGGKETVSKVEKNGGSAFFVSSNSAIPKDCKSLVNQAVQHFGRLDIAFNNAGIGGPQEPIGEYPIDGWDKVIGINLSGVFYGMRYQIPAMLKADGGSIVNIASILGKVGFANSSAYVAAKHGVVGLTQNAAIEYSSQNIRVNVVGPGFINTPLIKNNLSEDQRQQLVGLHPIGRLGEMIETAKPRRGDQVSKVANPGSHRGNSNHSKSEISKMHAPARARDQISQAFAGNENESSKKNPKATQQHSTSVKSRKTKKSSARTPVR